VEGFCKGSNVPSGSIQFGEFLDYLMTFELLRKALAPLSK